MLTPLGIKKESFYFSQPHVSDYGISRTIISETIDRFTWTRSISFKNHANLGGLRDRGSRLCPKADDEPIYTWWRDWNESENRNENRNEAGEDTYAGSLRAPRTGSQDFVSVFVSVFVFVWIYSSSANRFIIWALVDSLNIRTWSGIAVALSLIFDSS